VTVFQASHPVPVLDYHRVPYEVVPDHSELPFLGSIRPTGLDGHGGRLLWVRADARAELDGSCVVGRHRLGDSSLVGQVARDSAVLQWLQYADGGWHPTEAIRDHTGRRVASVWRNRDGSVLLPFDMGEVMENCWSERYRTLGRSRAGGLARAAVLRGYYLAKPAVPRSVQLALRRRLTRVQGRTDFPRWPVEDSLHDLYDWFLSLLAGVHGGPVPWLAPWPGGRTWALVLTHDVETGEGVSAIPLLRDAERAAGYRSSWNFVPERYGLDESVLHRLRDEGCEIGVHGLRHDGRDLGSRKLFDQRLPRIREYAERWQAVGFRSPATQRVWAWMPELGFDYDCSYTDTDPYEPQPGGCCSYLPFLNQDQVELPITLPQDHTLFAILGHTGGRVWLDKARHIRDRGGMALVLAHPDYAHDPHLASAWRSLLDQFCDDETAWKALPREVSTWWRRRAASTLREVDGRWQVVGPAAHDGAVRFATPSSPT
jgi:hypothetical protein